ncbi:GAF domain-containing protein [Parafrankia sp. FMc2]|uniref:GAF domain-containing protein n=1 Tax=Parafrankia sp. FMc2 TaxID=3233196 RepID=UPI0034D75A02
MKSRITDGPTAKTPRALETPTTAGNATVSGAGSTPVDDPRAQSFALRRLHEAVLGDARLSTAPRSVISESWRRSLAAQVNPDSYSPIIVYRPDEIVDVRSAHPLRAVLPLLRDLLVSIADASRHVMIVTDAEGTILWREGAGDLCRRADPVGLCEGARWAEDTIGTNAMGTALAINAPVQIYSAEHLVRIYHSWTCAAAPIHDPDTGHVLGTIDVSGLLDELHPACVSLVNAAAKLAESHLRHQMELRDERIRARNLAHLAGLRGEPGALVTLSRRVIAAEPHGGWPRRIPVEPGVDRVLLDDGREARVEPLPDGYLVRLAHPARTAPRSPTLSLSFLNERPAAVLDGREVPLTLRRAELLALLALHPGGLTGEQLATMLYGDQGNPTTVRASIHRLRAMLGESIMSTQPYRLRARVEADFLTMRAALDVGDVRTAVAACRTSLLPHSDAPAIRAERDQMVAALRSAVLGHHDVDALWTFTRSEPGSGDIEVFERLTRTLPAHDPRHGLAAARLAWLLADED